MTACRLLCLGWLGLCGQIVAPTPAPAAEAGCRPANALSLVVRLADGAPREAVLRATALPGLRLEAHPGGELLWSAAAEEPAAQLFEDMTAPFGESLMALDLDADGVHDRLYAGDRAGRLWRFEIRSGAGPAGWLDGGIRWDFSSADTPRAFVAPPDITWLQPRGRPGWLSVAVGTATAGARPGANRFYVLRDALDSDGSGRVFTEADLLRLDSPMGLADALPTAAPAGAEASLAAPGYYLDLGAAQVFAPSLTLEGRIHFTVVDDPEPLLVACAPHTVPVMPATVSVITLRAEDGAADQDSNGDGQVDARDLRRRLPRSMPADSRIELAQQGPDLALCQVGDLTLPLCQLDTSLRRRGWLREDVD